MRAVILAGGFGTRLRPYTTIIPKPDLDETAIVMNGDVLTTLDYRALVEYHEEREAALTIAMHAKHVDIDLGVIESTDGLVSDYVGKPSFDCDVSMGVYVAEP